MSFDDKSFKAFLEGGRRIIGDFKSGPSGLDINRAKTERVDSFVFFSDSLITDAEQTQRFV